MLLIQRYNDIDDVEEEMGLPSKYKKDLRPK